MTRSTLLMPLRSEMQLLMPNEGIQFLAPCLEYNWKLTQNLKVTAIQETQNFLNQTVKEPERQYIINDVFCLIQTRIWIRKLISLILDNYPNSCFFLPSTCLDYFKNKDETPGKIETFVDMIRYKVLAEELEGYDYTTYDEAYTFPLEPILYPTRRNNNLGELFLYALRQSTKKIVWMTRLPRTWQFSAESPLILETQPKKSRLLNEYLDANKILYQTLWADSENKPITGSLYLERASWLKLSSWDLVAKYATSLVHNLGDFRANIGESFFEANRSFITDQQNNAYSRLIIDEFLKRGMRASTVEEGASTKLAPSLGPLPFLYFNRPGICRLVNSEADRAFYHNHYSSDSIFVTGYLGRAANPSRVSLLLINLARKCLKGVDRLRGVGRTSVFVVPEIGTDWGSPINYTEVKSFIELMETLNSREFRVFMKIRHGEFIGLIKTRWPKTSVWQKIPWRWLALLSDVVIQADSSIGLESLCLLKKPVIIWNPAERPLGSLAWAANNKEAGVMLASSGRQLKEQVLTLPSLTVRPMHFLHFFHFPATLAEWAASQPYRTQKAVRGADRLDSVDKLRGSEEILVSPSRMT